MKLKYICKICDKEISSHGLGMHIKWHNLTKKEYYDKFLKKENEGICLRCGKETNFINIHSGYFKYCSCECSANSIEKQNSIKQTCLIKYGKTYNCVADKLGFSAYKAKYGISNPTFDPKIREKQRNKYTYNNENFDSSWELAYYIWLKDHNIDFEYQPDISFKYEYNGKIHLYFPDFKVGDEIIEIKGRQFFENGKMICPYNRTQDDIYEAKHQCMIKNNVKLILSNDIKFYINYIKEKYGSSYIKSLKIVNT